MEFVFDFGNSFGKWFVPSSGDKGNFRHLIAPLTQGEWNRIAGRAGQAPEGYVRVNGIPYAIGDATRRHTIRERPMGAARYVETYYGVGLAYAMAVGFRRSTRPVMLYATHAPKDIDYAIDLAAAATVTPFEVDWCGSRYTFVVKRVETIDEPLGGFNNYVLTKEGRALRNNPIRDETVLVVDVGGHTVDVCAVDPGGQIDLSSLQSTTTGVLKMIEDFTSEIRANNRLTFKYASELDPRRIDDAIRTGVWKAGKMSINCQAEADGAANALVYDIEQVINTMGSYANYDKILLTGGGAALLYERLQAAIPQIDFILSEPAIEDMQYSNVFGAAKLFRMMKRLGMI